MYDGILSPVFPNCLILQHRSIIYECVPNNADSLDATINVSSSTVCVRLCFYVFEYKLWFRFTLDGADNEREFIHSKDEIRTKRHSELSNASFLIRLHLHLILWHWSQKERSNN